MRLLVLGRSGQLARALAAAAPGATCLGRDELDLSDPVAVAAALPAHLAGADAVVNAAAWTAVDAAETQEDEARALNAAGPGAAAAACAAAGVPFVHVSTDYVFDGTGAAPRAPDAPVAPLGAYGRTKAAGEALVRAAGGPHAILRTSWVVSDRGPNFVATMLRLARTRDALRVVDDQVGGPTPADALAAACLAAAEGLRRDPGLSGTHHVAGAPDVSWAGFARAILKAAGRDVDVAGIPSADYPTPAPRPLNSRLDCASFEAAFGLPRPDWRAALPGIVAALEADLDAQEAA